MDKRGDAFNEIIVMIIVLVIIVVMILIARHINVIREAILNLG
jgi:competence protein ComGC